MTDNEELKIIKLLKSGSVNAKIAFELIKGFGYTELEFMLMLWDKRKGKRKLSNRDSLFYGYEARVTHMSENAGWIVRPHVINNKFTKTLFHEQDKEIAFKAFIEKLKTYDK